MISIVTTSTISTEILIVWFDLCVYKYCEFSGLCPVKGSFLYSTLVQSAPDCIVPLVVFISGVEKAVVER